MFKVGSKARTSWWSVCGQLWPGTQLPVLALSCAELPLSSPRPGPATLGTHSCLDCWLLAWHRCDIISPATTYYTNIPSLPFPTSGNTKFNLSEKLAYIGTQGQSQCMWCWQQWDSQWDQERPDVTNNERMTRSGHRKDNPRKKTPVSLLTSLNFYSLLYFFWLHHEEKKGKWNVLIWRDLIMLSDNCIHWLDWSEH